MTRVTTVRPTAAVVDDWRLFARRAALFLLPVVLLCGALEARLTRVPNSYARKRDLLAARRDAVEVLVVGSSHELEGVDTDIFTRPAFNLAMTSQSVAQSCDLARDYLHHLPKLRNVLLGVSYYSLSYRLAGSSEDFRIGFYMRAYGNFTESRFADLVDPRRYSYIGIYGWPLVLSIVRDHFQFSYGGRTTPTGFDDRPFPPALPADARPVSFKSNAESRASYHHAMERDENVPFNMACMRRLADDCKAAGVRLILFTSPVTPEYAAAFGEASWRRYRADIERFSSEVGAPYLDFSRSDQFEWRDFSDADHLNPNGAARFGRMLSDLTF